MIFRFTTAGGFVAPSFCRQPSLSDVVIGETGDVATVSFAAAISLKIPRKTLRGIMMMYINNGIMLVYVIAYFVKFSPGSSCGAPSSLKLNCCSPLGTTPAISEPPSLRSNARTLSSTVYVPPNSWTVFF